MNFHLKFLKYFLLKRKYILVTSELFQSEELTDLGDTSFDFVESVRRWRDIYKAQEIVEKFPWCVEDRGG